MLKCTFLVIIGVGRKKELRNKKSLAGSPADRIVGLWLSSIHFLWTGNRPNQSQSLTLSNRDLELNDARLAEFAAALFMWCIQKPETSCINCTKPLITAHNFLSHCNPLQCEGFHFLFGPLKKKKNPINVNCNLFTHGRRINFKYMKMSYCFSAYTQSRLSLSFLEKVNKRACVFNLTDRENEWSLITK